MPPRCIAQHHHCTRASMYSFPPLNSLLPVKAWRPPASPFRVGPTRPPGDGWTATPPARAVADSLPRCSLLAAGWASLIRSMGDIRTTPTSSRAWSVSGWIEGTQSGWDQTEAGSRWDHSILGVHVARDVPKPDDEQAEQAATTAKTIRPISRSFARERQSIGRHGARTETPKVARFWS
jgi:hypothetical protein